MGRKIAFGARGGKCSFVDQSSSFTVRNSRRDAEPTNRDRHRCDAGDVKPPPVRLLRTPLAQRHEAQEPTDRDRHWLHVTSRRRHLNHQRHELTDLVFKAEAKSRVKKEFLSMYERVQYVRILAPPLQVFLSFELRALYGR